MNPDVKILLFLFGNVQIWIHWTHRHDEKRYFKLGSSLSRIRRCQRDDFVFFYKFDVPSGRITLLLHDYEANII